MSIRKIILSLAIVLMTTASAFAIDWTGNKTLNDGQVITDNITLTGNVIVTVNTGHIAEISGIISCSSNFTLTKAGGGLLILSKNNTYPGTTIISAGALRLGNNGTTGSVAGTIQNNAELIFGYANNNKTCSNVISGSGKVGKWGGGKVTLTGENSYEGKTSVIGTLQIGDGTSGSIQKTNKVEITATSATLRFEPGDNMLFDKVIEGSGKVEYKGSNSKRLYLNADNTYTGTTTIETGVFFVGNRTTTGAVAGDIILQTAGAEMTFSRSNNYTYSGVISGKGCVWRAGAGKTTLTGVNTYEGPTTIYEGVLQIGDGTSGSINTTSNVVIETNGTLRFEPGGDMTFDKVISGQGKVAYKGTAGSKMLRLTKNNTYSGTTTIETGDLFIGDNGTTGSIAGNIIVQNGGNLLFNRSNEYTYSGIISGGNTGTVWKWGTGKTILTGTNTYPGETKISSGVLQIGNGTSGSINNTSNVVLGANGTLRFEPGSNLTFDKVISNSASGGKVEYKGTSSKSLYLTANNTYTGTTTIEAGTLCIGFNTSTGAVAGNIVNNGELHFYRANDYTYSGEISGSGIVWQYTLNPNNKLTLNGNNTYTGKTISDYGIIALGANGKIENSSEVILSVDGEGTIGKLDISAGNKTIKALSGTGTSNEVILDGSTLTIGTAGQAATGGGEFKGKFTGTGSVTKTGTETFIMSGANSATGTFTLSQGAMDFSGSWGGNFSMASAAKLDVKNNVTVGGTLTLQGGDIYMNLTTTVPSKITATGAASVSGNNKLHITADKVTNTAIIQAASGIDSTDPFTLNMPGYTATLTATGTQLLLNITGVGIDDVETQSIASPQIYPNPVNYELQITNYGVETDNYPSVQIFDIMGRSVGAPLYGRPNENGTTTINVEFLPTGVYFLKIGNKTAKFVKQ